MFLIREVLISPLIEEKIWTKHGVSPEEVEEVCFSDIWPLRGRDGSYAIYGRTDSGRYLVVFLYPKGEGIFNLATSREMTRVERQRYQQSRGS